MTTTTDNRLTYSAMRTAGTCLRKYFLAYVKGWRPAVEARPLRMGSAIHLGDQLVATGRTRDEAIAEVSKGYDDQAPVLRETGEVPFDYEIEHETVRCLIAAYFWRWDEMEQGMTTIAAEQAFSIPLINPETGAASRTFSLAGKIDRLVSLADGRLAVLETKTCSEDLAPESDYWRRLRIDSQISIYWHAARTLGHDVETVLYNVIRKPTIKPTQIPLLDESGNKIVYDAQGQRVYLDNGKPRQSADAAKGWSLASRRQTPAEYGERLTQDIGERPDYYFARVEIPRLDADLEEAQYEIWQKAAIIRDCQRFGRWPRETSACIGFGRCPYFELCTSGADLAGPVPAGYVRVDDVHPELSE